MVIMMVWNLLIKVEGDFMKIIFLTLLLTTTAFAQTSYSSADQNTSTSSKGNQNDNGYVNKDAENEDNAFSGEIESTAPMPQNQEEPTELSSGKNATSKKVKTPLDD